MKRIKRKLILSVFVVLYLFSLAGNGWSLVGLPQAGFNGFMMTYLDNGVNDDLMFFFSTINAVILSDGNLNPTDSILGATLTITGSKRTPVSVPGTTFTDAALTISDGVTTYFSATLTNIEFVLSGGLWRLNPGLDINNPATMNLKNIVLNPGPVPSDYIVDLQNILGNQTIAGMTMTLSVSNGDITSDSQSAVLEGIFDGVSAPPPVPAPAMNQWGMIIFIVLAGLGSIYYIRRKRAVS